MRGSVTCLALLLAACLDYREAFTKCVDAGRCDATGGGAGGAGGGSTGGGAGGGSVGPYDGGAHCSGSTRPRLRCGAPVQLASTGPFANAALARLPNGLAAAWSRGKTVELFAVSADGGMTPLLSDAADASVDHISLATEGDVWALVYVKGQNRPLRCFSSFEDAGVDLGSAAITLSAAVAVSADGGIAFAQPKTGSDMLWGVGARGCPRTLTTSRVYSDCSYGGAAHAPGTADDGFRFTCSGYFNISNGRIGIARAAADGGLDDAIAFSDFVAPYAHTTLLNAAGTHVMMAYEYTADAVSYDFGIRSMPVDLTNPVSEYTPIAAEGYSWAMAPCGAGCMATAFTQATGSPNVAAWFSNDDPIVEPRTGADAGWDVMCNTAVAATTVGVAWLGGQLRFLVVEPAKVSLVSCDVPPL